METGQNYSHRETTKSVELSIVSQILQDPNFNLTDLQREFLKDLSVGSSGTITYTTHDGHRDTTRVIDNFTFTKIEVDNGRIFIGGTINNQTVHIPFEDVVGCFNYNNLDTGE
jgi:hypothetical protein